MTRFGVEQRPHRMLPDEQPQDEAVDFDSKFRSESNV
jgi:hypothetical protein